MTSLSKLKTSVPYLYFISMIALWFFDGIKTLGFSALPILLFSIPFFIQIVKPNKVLNSILGVTFACLSIYFVLAFVMDLTSNTFHAKQFVLIGSAFVITNLIMSFWIVRNGIAKTA